MFKVSNQVNVSRLVRTIQFVNASSHLSPITPDTILDLSEGMYTDCKIKVSNGSGLPETEKAPMALDIQH